MNKNGIEPTMLMSKLLNKSITALVVILITGTTLFAQDKGSYQPWFFIQLTDPQFGMFEKNQGFEEETILYKKAVAAINQLKPDFVVITGDFVHNRNSKTEINEFKRITAKINSEIPVYYTPGNHDLGQIPDKQSLKEYHKNYGRDRFAFQHKGSAFIGFNSSLIKGRLEKSEQKQYKWLAAKLKKSRNADHIILFCHYPFFDKTVDEPETYGNIGPEYRKKYLSLFEANGVDALFFGHRHRNNLAVYGKMQLVTTSALGKPLGKNPSGMRIVKIYEDRIEHEYYGLDDLPDSVKFD